jgi:hypothetical protein
MLLINFKFDILIAAQLKKKKRWKEKMIEDDVKKKLKG